MLDPAVRSITADPRSWAAQNFAPDRRSRPPIGAPYRRFRGSDSVDGQRHVPGPCEESPCGDGGRTSSSLGRKASTRRGRAGGGGSGRAAPGTRTDGTRPRTQRPIRPGSSANTGAAQAPTTTQIAAPLNQVTRASETPKNPY